MNKGSARIKRGACINCSIDCKEVELMKSVKNYYGRVIQRSSDMKSFTIRSAGSSADLQPSIKNALESVHPSICDKYFGSAIIFPECLEGISVLDMGCGSGRDCYALSKLVGFKGHVIGVDMTDERLYIAREYQDYHTHVYGYANVEFRSGYIEDLQRSANVGPGCIDLVVSNHVINLTPSKEKVLKETHRILKVGGELYLADLFSNICLSTEGQVNEVLWDEGIGGAILWQQLVDTCQAIGFSYPRIYCVERCDIVNEELKQILGYTKFASTTLRMFKLAATSDTLAVDRGMCYVLTYLGGILDHEVTFKFDVDVEFKKDEMKTVCPNLWRELKISRFSGKFKFETFDEPSEIKQKLMNPFEILKNAS